MSLGLAASRTAPVTLPSCAYGTTYPWMWAGWGNRAQQPEIRLLEDSGFHHGCCFLVHLPLEETSGHITVSTAGGWPTRQGLRVANNHVSEIGGGQSPPLPPPGETSDDNAATHDWLQLRRNPETEELSSATPRFLCYSNWEITRICCFKPLSLGIMYGTAVKN